MPIHPKDVPERYEQFDNTAFTEEDLTNLDFKFRQVGTKITGIEENTIIESTWTAGHDPTTAVAGLVLPTLDNNDQSRLLITSETDETWTATNIVAKRINIAKQTATIRSDVMTYILNKYISKGGLMIPTQNLRVHNFS
jgi:hypothetical protein